MRRLALFARWPAAGEVKTRLSPALPAALALDLYRALLEDAIAVTVAAAADERMLYWADAPAAAARASSASQKTAKSREKPPLPATPTPPWQSPA